MAVMTRQNFYIFKAILKFIAVQQYFYNLLIGGFKKKGKCALHHQNHKTFFLKTWTA